MPVLHGRHRHHIDVLALHELADIDDLVRPIVKLFVDALGGRGQALSIRIADGDDPHALLLAEFAMWYPPRPPQPMSARRMSWLRPKPGR